MPLLGLPESFLKQVLIDRVGGEVAMDFLLHSLGRDSVFVIIMSLLKWFRRWRWCIRVGGGSIPHLKYILLMLCGRNMLWHCGGIILDQWWSEGAQKWTKHVWVGARRGIINSKGIWEKILEREKKAKHTHKWIFNIVTRYIVPIHFGYKWLFIFPSHFTKYLTILMFQFKWFRPSPPSTKLNESLLPFSPGSE